METKTTFSKKPLVIAVGTAIAGTSPLALAQSPGADSGLMEEILVTATRRETSMQDIPYNISAMSGEFMEQQNIVNQYDVLRAMHGITVVDRGYRNAGMVNSIVIRGLNVDNGAKRRHSVKRGTHGSHLLRQHTDVRQFPCQGY